MQDPWGQWEHWTQPQTFGPFYASPIAGLQTHLGSKPKSLGTSDILCHTMSHITDKGLMQLQGLINRFEIMAKAA